jgi:hypothetical protein
MARCAACDEAIPYGSYWSGLLRNAMRVRPIVMCGVCGQANVQVAMSSVLHLFTISASLVVTGVIAQERAGGMRGVLLLVAAFVGVEAAWWTFAAKLEKHDYDDAAG